MQLLQVQEHCIVNIATLLLPGCLALYHEYTVYIPFISITLFIVYLFSALQLISQFIDNRQHKKNHVCTHTLIV